MSDITATIFTPAGRRVGVASENTLQGADVTTTNDLDKSVDDFIVMDSALIERHPMAVSELATKAVDLAYGINRAEFVAKDAKINGGHLANTHWEVLAYSHNNDETNQYGYKAVAFINRDTHEIHIASAGTVLDCHDLLDDLLIAGGSSPNKLQPLKAFIDRVVQQLQSADGHAETTYQFSTSGHSLGAVVADLTALEIAARGLSLVSSTTFENPGSETAIQAVLSNHWLSGDIDRGDLAELRQRCTVYNARCNLINSTQPQFAAHCNVVLPSKSAETKPEEEPASWVGYLYGKLGSAVNTCASYLGLSHLAQVKEDHGLQNFQDLAQATVIPVHSWPDRWQYGDPLIAQEPGRQFFGEKSPSEPSSRCDLFFVDEMDSLVNITGFSYDGVQKISNARNQRSSPEHREPPVEQESSLPKQTILQSSLLSHPVEGDSDSNAEKLAHHTSSLSSFGSCSYLIDGYECHPGYCSLPLGRERSGGKDFMSGGRFSQPDGRCL